MSALAALTALQIAGAIENRKRWSFEARLPQGAADAEIGDGPAKACYVRLDLSLSLFFLGRPDDARGEIERALRDCPQVVHDLASIVRADLAEISRQPDVRSGDVNGYERLLAGILAR
jgi:hypothetical protein